MCGKLLIDTQEPEIIKWDTKTTMKKTVMMVLWDVIPFVYLWRYLHFDFVIRVLINIL